MNNIIKKSFENLFEKGGEGSRGGKVIGHTKTGKPVYETGKKGDHAVYKNFSKEDHEDAGKLHKQKSEEYQKLIPEHAFKTSGLRGHSKHPLMTKRDYHYQRWVEHDLAVSRLKKE